MARRTAGPAEAPPAAEVVEADLAADAELAQEPSDAPEQETAAADVVVEIGAPPLGEWDLEQWVADVYDYQHNGGPMPVRKYLPALQQ